MGNSDNNSQQFDGDDESSETWDYEDDWEEDSIHARKEHQDHRGRSKGHVRHSIESFKEQQHLKELLGDDYEDFED